MKTKVWKVSQETHGPLGILNPPQWKPTADSQNWKARLPRRSACRSRVSRLWDLELDVLWTRL